MNIVHFTHGKVNPFGESGMSRTVYFLNKYQRLSGHNSQIWSVVDGVKEHEQYKRDVYVTVEMFPRVFSFSWFKKNGIIDYIKKNKNKIDIVHFHLMWMYEKNLVAKTFRKLNIPYIVTPHSAYSRDRVMKSSVKKYLAKRLYELDFLNMASSVHSLCYEELTELREYGVRPDIFVIPNGMELEEVPDSLDNAYLSKSHNIPNDKVKIAWLGILKPVKNLEALILSATLLPEEIKKQVCFVLIGPDLKGYRNHLMKIAEQKGVSEMFYFVGPKYLKEKYDALASSDVYIHPSLSEGVSFAILDAMACNKPCIFTRTSNMTYYFKNEFFSMVEPWPDDIARGIVEIINNRKQWKKMGSNARKLIVDEFSWERVNERMLEAYERIINSKNG